MAVICEFNRFVFPRETMFFDANSKVILSLLNLFASTIASSFMDSIKNPIAYHMRA
jgi:hypothetical protein